MKYRFSVVTKLTLAGFSIAVILILFLLFITSTRFNPVLIDISTDRLEAQTLITSEELKRELDFIESDVLSLVRTPPVAGLVRASENNGFDEVGNSSYEDWKARMEVIFSALMETRSVYTQLRILDKSGQELVRTNYADGFIEVVPTSDLQDKSDRYYFRESIDLGFGDVYTSPVDLNREGVNQEIIEPYEGTVRFATPFFGGDILAQGVVVANINFDLIIDRLGNTILPGADLYVVDGAGNFLVHPDPAKEWGGVTDLNTGENIERNFDEDLLAQVVSREDGTVLIDDTIWSFVRIEYGDSIAAETKPLVVLKSFPADLLFAETQAFARQQLLLGALALLLAGFINWLFIKNILRPLRGVRDALEQYTEGNLQARPPAIRAKDEIADMAEFALDLAQDIRDERQKVEERVRSRTERLVEQQDLVTNQQRAILNIMDDVESEKERAELTARDLQKFQLAAESASDQIVITDADGVIIYANPAIQKITGYSQEEVVGKKAGSSETWGGLMPATFYKKMWYRLKEEKSIFTGQIKNQHKDGHTYYAHATISPILGKDGQVQFFVAIERDITKEKEIDEAKTEFVSLASHQLRTPLSAINWYTEMLLDGDAGEVNEEQQSYLQEIYTGNQRMVDLVNALLNVSRLELGTFTIDPEPTNLQELIRSVLEELQSQLVEKNMTVIEDVAQDIPEVSLDPRLFRIIVQNLLSNATKYTPENGQVTVRLQRVQAGNAVEGHTAKKESFLFQVADNGIGIPSQQQDRVFSKLFRADNVHKVDSEGTGLGLYAIKKVVEVSGGEIWFVSKEDIGTTFSVMLPMAGMAKRQGRTQLIEMSK